MHASVLKVDILRPEELREDAKSAIGRFEGEGVVVLPMSTVTEEGIMEIKTQACDMLLAQRVEMKMKGKKIPDVLNRLHLAVPAPRDEAERPPFIPPGARVKKAAAGGTGSMEVEEAVATETQPRKKLEREIELEMGDDYFLDLKKNYLLPDDSHKYDLIPEIYEGKNVADFIDPDIMLKLEELEREEEMREAAGMYDSGPEDEATIATRQTATAIRKKRAFLRKQSWDKKSRNYPVMPRGVGQASRPKRATGTEGEEMETQGTGGDGSGEGMEDGESANHWAILHKSVQVLCNKGKCCTKVFAHYTR